MTMGIVVVAFLAGPVREGPAVKNYVYLETNHVGDESWNAVEISVCITEINDKIFPST